MSKNTVLPIAWIIAALFFIAACDMEEAVPEKETGDREVAEKESRIDPINDCALTMGWDPWEPYQYRTPTGEVAGLDVELIEAAAQLIGCDISHQQSDFISLLNDLRSGEVDFLPGATQTQAREEFARFSIPYRDEQFALWVREKDAELFAEATLEGLLEDRRRVGFTEGFIYGDDAEDLMARPEYEDLLSSARIGDINLMRLIEGDIDALIEDPHVATSVQRRLGLESEVARLEQELVSGQVHLMFSRESVKEETVARFNEALEQLIDDGTRDRIIDRYTVD